MHAHAQRLAANAISQHAQQLTATPHTYTTTSDSCYSYDQDEYEFALIHAHTQPQFSPTATAYTPTKLTQHRTELNFGDLSPIMITTPTNLTHRSPPPLTNENKPEDTLIL